MSISPPDPGWTGTARPEFRLLSDAQLRQVHEAALEILWTVGSRFFDPESVQMLEAAGCLIEDGNLVKIPAALVEDCLSTVPSRIVLHSRDGEPALYLEDRNTYFGTGSDLLNIIDLETGTRRPSGLHDIEDMARVVDALPNMDFCMSMGSASEAPSERTDRYAYRAMVTHTAKPIVYTAWDVEGARDIISMAEAVAGGEEALAEAPTLLAYLEPTSPLRHSDAALRKLLFLAGKGLPYAYVTGASAGAVAPATQAGVLVQATADVLPGLVLGQLKRPGTPFLWGASCSPLDMRNMVSPYATPEEMLQDAAAAEIAHRFYHVPVWGLAGAADSKVPDMQAAAEGAVSLTVAALAGANLVHDCGYLESGLSGAFETLLLSDETAGLCRRFMAGINFSPEDLAVDVIREVGPGGTYLSTEHTVRHFREFWRPRWFDHETYETWAAKGSRTCEERLRDAARQILADQEVEPLPAPVLARLDAITET